MISKKAINKIKEINSLIKEVDRSDEKSNNYAFLSMKEHIEEIKELFLKKDQHWAEETIDLLIHCILLLERNGYQIKEINRIFKVRCERFKEKISNQFEKK